jgi:hypothetical protein
VLNNAISSENGRVNSTNAPDGFSRSLQHSVELRI